MGQERALMLLWLEGRLPVPKLLAHASENGLLYLLETRLPGEMACSENCLRDGNQLLQRIADALRLLWSVDVADCPVDQSPDALLAAAARWVSRGQVDKDNVDPATFGPGGFRDPADLLDWLIRNKPSLEDPVLVHGDLCLTNVFLQGNQVSGFLDLPGAGAGDRWRDLAICMRSLQDHLDGHHGRNCPGFHPEQLLELLGIAPDPLRWRWYLLLDELF